MLYHVGDSQHTQNIQMNKVIVENEKCVFHFMEKHIQTFWPIQSYTSKGYAQQGICVLKET